MTTDPITYTSSPFVQSTTYKSPINPYSCHEFCKNEGGCSLTGPKMTAVCSCSRHFRGQRCEEQVMWFIEFFVQDDKLTGNGAVALICICLSVAIVSFLGILYFKRYRARKSKSEEKQSFEQNNNPVFDELQASSQQRLLVYHVEQPASSTSPPPAPCSPQGQGICYLVPTSPEQQVPDVAWQDYHNPGYRQSYIDSGI